MRRVAVVLVSVLATLGMLAPPSFAQAPAAPPAPKVTINGLFDFVTSIYKNASSEGTRDLTDGGLDNGWYSRERGVITLTGEVGRTKGVLALEFDFHNGRTDNNLQDAGFGGNAGFDMETDEKGQVETKWLYLETPITGPGALMPFIPVPSIGRFGAQPARGHDYKPAIQFTGDFPGVTLETTWAPNVRTTLTYAQIEEALDMTVNPGGNDNKAFLVSAEIDVQKGLTVKPTYSYMICRGGCVGNTANRLTAGAQPLGNSGVGTFARGGFDPNGTTGTAQQTMKETIRHTLGGDVRWTSGPWSVQPTFLYQWGQQECGGSNSVAPGATDFCPKRQVDISTWIFDVVGGFRTGPLNIEGRLMYTPGMKAAECVQAIAGVCGGGDDIRYYEPILNASAGYWSGWTELDGSGIDYNIHARQTSGSTLGRSPSYDKYGRVALGVAADYQLTPALTFRFINVFQWTAEEVDTSSRVVATSGGGGGVSFRPVSSGDQRWLGWEPQLGLTYRFAPNVAFDMIGAYLLAGEAREHGRAASTTAVPLNFSIDDSWKIAARMRLTF